MEAEALTVRRYRPADLSTLIALFQNTVRQINSRDYSPEQIRAWAPDEVNPDRSATLAERFTVVAEMTGEIVGFTDMEPDGHVDRFFVHADYQGQGVGRALMEAVTSEAKRLGLAELFAEVSITARPFFERQGFLVEAEQQVLVRGVTLTNYRMRRLLGNAKV